MNDDDDFDRDFAWMHLAAETVLNRPWPADMAREWLATWALTP